MDPKGLNKRQIKIKTRKIIDILDFREKKQKKQIKSLLEQG